MEWEDAVKIICEQESTARFVARHLYHFFVADELPVPQWPHEKPRDPKAIDLMVKAYFESDHNIKAMLKVLFESDFFKDQSSQLQELKALQKWLLEHCD